MKKKITEGYNLLLSQNSWNWAIYKELKLIWLTVVGVRDPQKHSASVFQLFYSNHPAAYNMAEDTYNMGTQGKHIHRSLFLSFLS